MRIILYLVALALVPGWPAARAQGVAKSLPECIREAVENNLAMQSGRIAIERARELQGTAFNIGRTTLSLGQDPTSGGNPDNSFTLGQGFDFPTVYTSRRALLKAETDLERGNLEVTRNELVREVSSLYYRLLYERENIKVLQEQDSIYDKFLFLATAKFKSGETGRLEQMNAERLYNENKLELQKAATALEATRLALQRWMNTGERVEPAGSTLEVAELARAGGFEPGATPAARVLDGQARVSEKNLALARQGFLPDFNVAVRRQYLIPGYNPYRVTRERFDKGNFTGFEVGVSLPLFFGEQRARTRAARRDVEIARTRQQETLAALDNDYRVAMNEHLKARSVLDYYRERGSEQAREINRISRVSYEKGEIGYVEYIQNLKTAVELRLQHAGAINDYNQTVIMLNYLQGNQ
jgi:cobalt-zinc-cadmium resistance protein CzcA